MPPPTFLVLDEFSGQNEGPYNPVELCELIEKRKLKPKTLVCRVGTDQWNTAAIVLKKLFDKVEGKKKAAKDEAKRSKLEAKKLAEEQKQERLEIKAKAKKLADEQKRSKQLSAKSNSGEDDFDQRSEFTEPEILRTNLASVILQMEVSRLGKMETFPFVEAPDSRLITDGYQLLIELGAVTTKRKVVSKSLYKPL